MSGQATACRSLWAAVLLRMIKDATAIPKPPGQSCGSGTTFLEQDSARGWLTRPNRGFKEVCELAEFDPGAVREAAERMMERAA